LEALRRTYGYEPVVYTTTPPGRDIANGMVFCRVRSWLTGSRLVSVPFSDHCQPLVDNSEAFAELMSSLAGRLEREGWKYIELRPLSSDDLSLEGDTLLAKSETYCLHIIDVRPDLDTLFHSFHKRSVRHKLNRAERENLIYEAGHSEALLAKFYNLLILTRRRHQLPPQPLMWFRNLIDCLGDKVTIRIASKDGQPIASVMTLYYGKSLVSKYACSDDRLHHLGGVPLLIWKGIQECKQEGATSYDLGRSEPENTGLVTFKDNWAAARSALTYYRYPPCHSLHSASDLRTRVFKHMFSHMPDLLLVASGRFLYRHIG
jgi:hypothetical protein